MYKADTNRTKKGNKQQYNRWGFNTTFSAMARSTIYIKLTQSTGYIKNIQNIAPTNSRIHILLKHTQSILLSRYILGHKTSYKKIGTISSIFCNHNVMKLSINKRKKTGKFIHSQKLNNTLLNNHWVKEESRRNQKLS